MVTAINWKRCCGGCRGEGAGHGKSSFAERLKSPKKAAGNVGARSQLTLCI